MLYSDTLVITRTSGESEEDFLELKNFISEFRFDRLGVFAYSHEEGTFHTVIRKMIFPMM